jgi:hypothetical protein
MLLPAVAGVIPSITVAWERLSYWLHTRTDEAEDYQTQRDAICRHIDVLNALGETAVVQRPPNASEAFREPSRARRPTLAEPVNSEVQVNLMLPVWASTIIRTKTYSKPEFHFRPQKLILKKRTTRAVYLFAFCGFLVAPANRMDRSGCSSLTRPARKSRSRSLAHRSLRGVPRS